MLFLSLLNSKSELYARLELGRLEKEVGNIEKSKEYFLKIQRFFAN
jgi:hypothetical protein